MDVLVLIDKLDDLVPKAVARRFTELYPDGRPGAPVSPSE